MFLLIFRILNNVRKPDLVQRQPQFKVRSILATASFLRGCEIWTLKQRDIRSLRRAEIKFMRRTAVCNLLAHKRN